MKEQIENAIFATVSNIDQWQYVLELLVKATGASKGIITLRDRMTAELVIPNDVRQELASPLVYGFTEEQVHAYITEYIACDPWTEIENRYHPEEPYALSTHIDRQALKNSKFWEWLEPQGIDDTVIFKIGDSSAKYWVAMNLYYAMDADRKTQIPRYLLENKNIIQNAWKLGQKLRLGQHQSSYAEYFMEQQTEPCFLLNSNSEVLQKNHRAEELLRSTASPFFISATKLLHPGDKQLKNRLHNVMDELQQTPFARHETPQQKIDYQNQCIQVCLIGKAQSLLGEDTALFLLLFHQTKEKYIIWEDPSLTQRERDLVEILAKGGRVVDFQNHYSLAKSTAHMHWQHVKEKLKVNDRSDIHAAYEVYLQRQSQL